MAGDKPAGDSSKIASDFQPLIIRQGRKKAPNKVIDMEKSSRWQITPPLTTETSSRLKMVCF